MNIYFDKTIYEKNKQFYDDCLKCVDIDGRNESKIIADVKKFLDDRINPLHDRLSYLNEMRSRDSENFESSLRDVGFTINHIEKDIKKIGQQIESLSFVIDKQANKQKILIELLDKFDNEFETLKDRLKNTITLFCFQLLFTQ